jgi:class 3 adenylate cyclase
MEIFTWARSSQLFRLAEAALYAIARINIRRAADLCVECMVPPVKSKILAIASIRLLKNLNWDVIEQSVVRLFAENKEAYIMLNLIDALAAMDVQFGDTLIRAALKRLESEYDPEILSRMSGFIGEKAGVCLVDDLTGIFQRTNPVKKVHVLNVITRIVQKNRVPADLGFSEFLYRVIREESDECKNQAAILLYHQHDDYAVKVLHDLLKNADVNGKTELVRGLRGALRSDAVSLVGSLVYEEAVLFHETLRDTLLSIQDQEAREHTVGLMLKVRGVQPEDEDSGFEPEQEIQLDLSRQKSAYRFEKEHIVEQGVMFTDIKGYSKKAQSLNSMELTTMLNEYEGILIPIVTSHCGELVKRMGDGHLFTFDRPLNAVLAGIRVQKALKRYNSFREEKYRVIIRVGMHWGQVVRKAGDVYGNTVNIASRLESNGKEGSVYISDALEAHIKDHVLSREIGPIQVKGISEPVVVYEPYEIAVDLPAELDPLKRSAQGMDHQKVDAGASASGASAPVTNQRSGSGDAASGGAGDAASGGVTGGGNGGVTGAGKPAVKTGGGRNGQGANGGAAGAAPSSNGAGVDRKLIKLLQQTFISLNDLCLKAEKGQVELPQMRRELAARWKACAALIKKEHVTKK